MLKEKFQEFIKRNEEGNQKKKIENLVVFLVILVITVIAINMILKDKNDKNENTSSYKELAEKNTLDENSDTSSDLEKNLEKILAKLNGVGKVNVLITYSESNKVVAMYNENSKESTTEEEDTGGGKRTIQEVDTTKDVVYKEENGSKIPVTERIIMPKVEGAIIIAEGANNSNVKANIVQAVEAVTGLATHKIQVFDMKTREELWKKN